MKKLLTGILVVMAAWMPAAAETVSQKQAQEMANAFFNEAFGHATPPPRLIYNGRRLTTDRLFNPFYVYNANTGGFVIISAENKAFPILGYSLKESFDNDKLGDAELALLRSYAREIELIRYDSQPVYDTEMAWIDFGGYVRNLLKAPYVATDPKFSTQEAEYMVEDAENDGEAVYADIYTPDQWRDMILDELRLKESVPLIIDEERNDYGMVVYGHKGDYFRIEMSQRNQWLMRLNATEIISANMISAVVKPIELKQELFEEQPFAYLDEYLEEVAEIEASRSTTSSIEQILAVDEPVLRPLGGGHYEVTAPENVELAIIYNLSGAMVGRHTYGDTMVANINIESEPRGFYFLNLIGESGKNYGLKLYR